MWTERHNALNQAWTLDRQALQPIMVTLTAYQWSVYLPWEQEPIVIGSARPLTYVQKWVEQELLHHAWIEAVTN